MESLQKNNIVFPMNELSPKPKYIPKKKYDKSKKKFNKLEVDFLTDFAKTNNRIQSMKNVGLDTKKDGTKYTDDALFKKSWALLHDPGAQKIVADLQREIREQNCLTLDMAVNESYQTYLMLKERKSFHEMNTMWNTFLQVGGMLKPGGVTVQTQIVAGENGLTINYIQPKKEDDKNN